ncbi:MAG: aspartate/glutamate racemase family protein [Desulforhopalus sp.]
MKTIGLLGGMSWESTSHYYRLINQGISSKLGGLHSAKLVLLSIDFQPLELLMQRGEWNECGRRLAEDAKKVERAGADFLVICTNTMHKVAGEIAAALSIPILHIGDAVAERIKEETMHTVGLLGTRFTMEENFYVDRLKRKHDLSVIIPGAEDRQTVHDVIFDELCRGQINETSRKNYLRIIDTMRQRGAEAVIAGCTEIGMLINSSQTSLPLFDTTEIHANHAVRWSLSPHSLNKTAKIF